MDYKTVLYEKDDRVAVITLNRPQYRNAQSRQLLEDVDAAFQEARNDDEIRVVILAGKGEHFCSGHDLGTKEEVADAEKRPYPEGRRGRFERSWNLYVEKSLLWRDLPKPTIAQVQGYCIYGGYLVAMCMDMIVAAEDAKFLPSHLQLFTAPWDLGVHKAKEILFENRFIHAKEALDLGLVNKVVPRDQLDEETRALAKRIAENDRMTLRMTKFSINQAQDLMGFRNAVMAAHSNYHVMTADIRERPSDRRLPGVQKALEKEKQK